MQVNTWRTTATLLGAVALVFALVGTAVGGPSALSKDVSKSTVKKVAKKQVKKLAPGLSVAKADSATSANSATTAGSAQPVAFALINSDGTVDAANSKGVTNANVTHPAAGVYCVSGVGFPIRGAQVTPAFGGTRGLTAQFNAGNTGNCPNGGQVLTSAPDNSPADVIFNILLYG